MSKAAAQQEWNDFLEQMQHARVELNCSVSSAWFRGHTNTDWPLTPSLLRGYVLGSIENNERIGRQLERHERLQGDGLFIEVFRLLGQRPLRLRITSDQKKRLRQLVDTALRTKEKLGECDSDIRKLRLVMREIRRATGDSRIAAEITDQELADVCARHNIPLVPFSGPQKAKDKSLKQINVDDVTDAHDRSQKEEDRLRQEIAAIVKEARLIIAVAYGERDAFTEFNFRWRETIGSSWEVLTRMQHYKVPTRLLDWTESLGMALLFALDRYVDLFVTETRAALGSASESRGEAKKIRSAPSVEELIERSASYLAPSVWILNPYYLTREATGDDRIADLTLEPNLNYYRCFFSDGWPYERPLPIYSPWREERIASQHGMFTVHGTDLRSLDKQVNEGVVKQISLSPAAAAVGARQLAGLWPVDRFSVFRDMDSLGQTVRAKYISRGAQSGRET
jgi:hypothetical protein